MVVTLSAETEATIQQMVADGLYPTASEALEAAVRLLDARDRRLQFFRAEVALGLAEAERGELIDYAPDMMERLMSEADENERLGLPVRDVVRP